MTFRKSLAPALLATSILALSVTGSADASAERAGKPAYKAYVSCANSAPYKAAAHCSYDKARLLRATYVIKSNSGPALFKVCFRLYGSKPLGGGGACATLPKPLTYKAYPFKISGVRQSFGADFTLYAKKPGAKGGYKRISKRHLKVNA